MEPKMAPVWRGKLLSSGMSVTNLVSEPIKSLGNRIIYSVTIVNISGGSVTFGLEVSADGSSWKDAAVNTAALTSMGYTEASVYTNQYPYARLRAAVSAGAAALFDASMAFSQL